MHAVYRHVPVRLRVLSTLILLTAVNLPAVAAEDVSSVVFGQVRLVGETLPYSVRMTVREVDSGKLERIALERREYGQTIFDFAEVLPPGRYFFYNLVAANFDGEFRISDAKNAFEVRPGATVYLGTWKIKQGIPTTTYTIDYDPAEIGLFAKANPKRDTTKFMIGVPGKPAVLLEKQ